MDVMRAEGLSRPRAVVVVIGNELLSGRTQDENLNYIAQGLYKKGIVLGEARVVSDDASILVPLIRSLKDAFDIVITTGGLGGTHDDITIHAIAEAVNQPCVYHPEAWEMTVQHYGPDLDPLYQKGAYFPEGSKMIPNSVTGAPGFSLHNIHALAGVPVIMRAMFDALLPHLPQGHPWHSQTLACHVGEDCIADQLATIQKEHPEVQIGSYPLAPNTLEPTLHLVLKADHPESLERAMKACIQLIEFSGDQRYQVF